LGENPGGERVRLHDVERNVIELLRVRRHLQGPTRSDDGKTCLTT